VSPIDLEDEAGGWTEVDLAEPGFPDADWVGTPEFADMLDVPDDSPTEAPADGGLFVTPDGAWVAERSKEFFAALGDPDPDYDAALFAVKNLGFVAVRVSRSVVDIKLHPRNITSAALTSIQQLLPLIAVDFFQITYLTEEWTAETVSSAAKTICRLSEICVSKEAGVSWRERPTVVH
jgi:hypothetical protein